MHKVSVVIPTLNRAEVLATTIDGIEHQTVPRDLYELLVVDNNSSDHTQAVLTQKAAVYPNLKIGFQPRPGAAAARNTGIRFSSGEIVLFIDDDIFAEPGLIEAHITGHRENPGASIVGTVVPQWDSTTDPFLRYLRDAQIFSPYNFACDRPMNFSDYHTGNVSTIRKQLHEVGGFDERFFLYGMEDIELGYRLQKQGFHMVPGVLASGRHEYFPTSGQFLKKCQQAGYSLGILIDLHPELGRQFVDSRKFTGMLKRFYSLYPILMSALTPFSERLVAWERRRGKRALTPALDNHYALAIRYHFFLGFQAHLRSKQSGLGSMAAAPHGMESYKRVVN